MSDIVLFVPKAEHDAVARMGAFIGVCRNELTVFGSELAFDEGTWDVTQALAIRGKGNKRVRITFSTAASVDDREPQMMREPFLSFAKAYVRYMHGMRPTKVIHNRVAALRAIEASLGEAGAVPNPVHVDSRVLNRAVQLVGERFSAEAAYRVGQQIEMVARFLVDNRLTTSMSRWRNPLKRPGGAVRVGKDFDERRAAKLPSEAALDALPRLFGAAVHPQDVIVVSVAAILLSAPDRIGEVLTLPESCEVREPRTDGVSAYGLRWWPEKKASPMIKWIVPSMASVVEEALGKIRAVTDEARRIAEWYEGNPSTIYLCADVAHLRGRDWLSMAEVANVIGLNDRVSARAWCVGQAVATSKLRGNREIYARFGDVEHAVLSMLPRSFPVLDAESNLRYSEALFVVRRNELGSQRGTYRCMIEAVTTGHINTGLGSRSRHGFATVFSRFGYTEPDGSAIKITTHQFRHYLNTLAQVGGLSQLDIAKWSGRKDVRQNEAYDHVSSGQMLEIIRAAVGGDEIRGPMEELRSKVLIRRDEFARLVVPSAHTTDIGYCIHDYTSSPCQIHMDCIHCQELVCVKADTKRTRMLRQRLTEARGLLEKAKAAVGEGYSGSDRWMEHHRSTVDRLTQLCGIMDDPSVPIDAVVQLAAPQPPTQALRSQGQLEASLTATGGKSVALVEAGVGGEP